MTALTKFVFTAVSSLLLASSVVADSFSVDPHKPDSAFDVEFIYGTSMKDLIDDTNLRIDNIYGAGVRFSLSPRDRIRLMVDRRQTEGVNQEFFATANLTTGDKDDVEVANFRLMLGYKIQYRWNEYISAFARGSVGADALVVDADIKDGTRKIASLRDVGVGVVGGVGIGAEIDICDMVAIVVACDILASSATAKLSGDAYYSTSDGEEDVEHTSAQTEWQADAMFSVGVRMFF